MVPSKVNGFVSNRGHVTFTGCVASGVVLLPKAEDYLVKGRNS